MDASRHTHPDDKAQPEAAALFVSDVHLQQAMPRTAALFLSFLERHAVHAPQLYLMGDLFEYWAGDDDLVTDFPAQIAAALRAVADAGVAVCWLGGNRDFLIGSGFAQAAKLTLLSEPHVARIAGKRVVLVHGDAQCTDDRDYQAFRAQVRQPAWQAAFVAQPLEKRKAIIAGMREGSRAAQQGKAMEIMDVNAEAIDALFASTGAEIMVHGHTHRPALHRHAHGLRYVLPDWDGDAEPARGGWLALGTDGAMRRFDAHGVRIDD
jgi:UDP-2,3-diacylglucosamine hydrolase